MKGWSLLLVGFRLGRPGGSPKNHGRERLTIIIVGHYTPQAQECIRHNDSPAYRFSKYPPLRESVNKTSAKGKDIPPTTSEASDPGHS